MNFTAGKHKLPFENGLPQVSLDYINRYKSKPILTDQWSSHPSVEDQVLRLHQLAIKNSDNDNRPAFSVFKSSEILQEKFCMYLLKPESDQPVAVVSQQQFEAEYLEQYGMYAFSDIYNQYYDYRSIQPFDQERAADLSSKPSQKISDLFGSEMVGLKYEHANLEDEIATLQQFSWVTIW